MSKLYEIKSKAQYISDLAIAMMAGCVNAEMPPELIDDCCRKLQEVADALDEYHDFGLEE